MSRLTVILISVLIVLSGLMIIGAAGYVGYALGDHEGYIEGYEQGHSDGEESGYSQGYEEGYMIGCIAGAGSGYTLRNPTYWELQRFLRRDRTDENEYKEGVYTCVDFVADLNNNAEGEGFRAAYVYIEFPGERAHTVAAFETVNKGLIYIEPQYDDEVKVRLGISYAEENGYLEPDYDDTIDRVVIVW